MRRQSRDYLEALRAAGESTGLRHIAGAHHLSILAQLESPEGPLLADVLALIERSRR